MGNGKCKFCEKNNLQLVNSHIIPKSLYGEVIRDNLGQIISLEDYPKKSPIGIYDSNLVCETCEAIFSPYDDYAKKFFSIEPQQKDVFCIDPINQMNIWRLNEFDYTKLKLFFLSLLWRTSETTASFFGRINLGKKYTKQIKEMILNGNPGKDNEFTPILIKYTDFIGKRLIMEPAKSRMNTGRYVNIFHLAGYKVVIHIGVVPKTAGFLTLGLTQKGPMNITVADFEKSIDFRDVLKFFTVK